MFAPLAARTQITAASSQTKKPAPQRSKSVAQQYRTAGAADWAHLLQQIFGNQATLRLLSPEALGRIAKEPQASGTALPTADRTGLIPANRNVFAGGEPDLRVSTPGDRHEQEADQVAQQALHPAEQQPQRRNFRAPGCSECRAAQPATKSPVRQTSRDRTDDGIAAPAEVGEALHSSSAPLDPQTQTLFEASFGHDFRAVRVHTDAAAADSARALNARAYTVGTALVFADGQYRPATPGGRQLLAHELAHVVQQSRFADPMVQRACSPAAECAKPVQGARIGSATQFGQQVQQTTAPKLAAKRRQTAAQAQSSGHGRRAVEVEKLFREQLPDQRRLIHDVFLDDTLPAEAGALHTDCHAWADDHLPKDADKSAFEGATHGCIFVPQQLEQQAAIYNHHPEQQPDRTLSRDEWLQWVLLRPLTHEVTHERFTGAHISYPSYGDCNQRTLAKELGELAAVISEFPIVNQLKPDLIDAWSDARLKDPRREATHTESIAGSIREIRCSCECGDADALVRAAFAVAAASWTEDDKQAFHAYMVLGKGREYGVPWPFEVSRVGRHQLSITAGLARSGSEELAVAALTYRYVLRNWAEGRFRLTGGAQLNLASGGERIAGTVGLQYISSPVSRARTFGGLTARLDTGFGSGEFALKPAGPADAEATGRRDDWILEIGSGVRFFVPGLLERTPITLEGAYRLAEPLDSNARHISTFSVSAGIEF
jgi:hypothetical protein